MVFPRVHLVIKTCWSERKKNLLIHILKRRLFNETILASGFLHPLQSSLSSERMLLLLMLYMKWCYSASFCSDCFIVWLNDSFTIHISVVVQSNSVILELFPARQKTFVITVKIHVSRCHLGPKLFLHYFICYNRYNWDH